jgi:hypothetical protein
LFFVVIACLLASTPQLNKNPCKKSSVGGFSVGLCSLCLHSLSLP